jgi:hypothetical protein
VRWRVKVVVECTLTRVGRDGVLADETKRTTRVEYFRISDQPIGRLSSNCTSKTRENIERDSSLSGGKRPRETGGTVANSRSLHFPHI